MKHLILVIFTLTASHSLLAQDSCCSNSDTTMQQTFNSLDVSKKFIYAIADLDTPTDVILSQYVTVNHADDEMYEYLLASLDEIRLNVMSKNVDDIQFLRYTELPKKEVNDIDIEGKNTEHMYFLQYRKRQMTALYIENGKVASFTLVSKGNNKAHFVTY